MHLCIVTPSKPSATETFIRAHLENLPFEITHLHSLGGGPTCDHQNLRDSCGRWLNLLPRFIEFRIRQKLYPSPSDTELLVDFLKQQKIDVVLAEYGTTAAVITPACQKAGIPLVTHFHGYDASRYDVIESYAARYHQMFHYSSAVISVSKAMSSALLQLGCPQEKLHLNSYGPSPIFFDVRPDFDSKWLLAVGRLTAKKAPYLTLDAYRRARETCPDLKLRLVGVGELKEVCDRLIDAWNLREHIDLIEFASPQQIANYMKDAFAFVQHSVRASNGDEEGTPVAILEAGAAGLPVISTLHAGIPDVVVDRETGYLVECGDSNAMASRITHLAMDRSEAPRTNQG
jgi:colanic acid/amylovoran biosynthesis glycosyltransferase